MPSRDPQIISKRMLRWLINGRCDVSVFETLCFHPSLLDGTKRRFQEDSLWKAFSKTFVFGDRKRRLRAAANPKRIKKMRVQKDPDTCGRGLKEPLSPRILCVNTAFWNARISKLAYKQKYSSNRAHIVIGLALFSKICLE